MSSHVHRDSDRAMLRFGVLNNEEDDMAKSIWDIAAEGLIPKGKDFAHLIPNKTDWEGIKSLVKADKDDHRPIYERISDRAFKGKK